VGNWGVPVIPLLAKANLETLRACRSCPGNSRWCRLGRPETAHNLEHSIVSAASRTSRWWAPVSLLDRA